MSLDDEGLEVVEGIEGEDLAFEDDAGLDGDAVDSLDFKGDVLAIGRVEVDFDRNEDFDDDDEEDDDDDDEDDDDEVDEDDEFDDEADMMTIKLTKLRKLVVLHFFFSSRYNQFFMPSI